MSYFHSVFKRHMNMATQIIETGFDRVTPLYYETKVSNFANLIQGFYLKGTTFSQIDNITLYIRDVAIQSFTGEWIRMYHELRTPTQKVSLLYDSSYVIVPFKKYIPVFDECKIVLELNSPNDAVSLLIDYVFLDAEPEKQNMVVEQMQMFESIDPVVRMNLKHPVKEFYISVDSAIEYVTRIRFDINEFTKIDETAMYFRYVQPLDYHTRVPGTFFTYSFCLDPESELPTGSINMGRIKNQTVRLTYDPAYSGDKHITVYAQNYNILTPDGYLVYT